MSSGIFKNIISRNKDRGLAISDLSSVWQPFRTLMTRPGCRSLLIRFCNNVIDESYRSFLHKTQDRSTGMDTHNGTRTKGVWRADYNGSRTPQQPNRQTGTLVDCQAHWSNNGESVHGWSRAFPLDTRKRLSARRGAKGKDKARNISGVSKH